MGKIHVKENQKYEENNRFERNKTKKNNGKTNKQTFN